MILIFDKTTVMITMAIKIMIMMMLIFDKTLSRLGKLMRASTIDQVMMIEAGDKNIVTGKYQNMFFSEDS